MYSFDVIVRISGHDTLDSLIDDTLVINDTHGRYPPKFKRHPCNKRHSWHLGEKEIKDTQFIKRHSGHITLIEDVSNLVMGL